MAKFGVFRNGKIIINAYDLSDHCMEFSINPSTTALPDHAMGDQTALQTPGLYDWQLTCRFFQDFVPGKIFECFENMRLNRTKAPFVVYADADQPISATNPAYSGSCFIGPFRPIGGAHGDNLIVEATFLPAGNLSTLTA